MFLSLQLFCAFVNCFPIYDNVSPIIPVEKSRLERNAFKNPIVWTPFGALEGFLMKTIKGRPIAAFQGIPYAEPPVGDLRFSKPIPLKPWHGVRKAMKPGSNCLQINIFKYFIVEGKEDCLYLNVYTPYVSKSENLLPVIMFIHGGGHLSGTGNDYGPSYLLDREVILVTINYRLGILGFMSTGDEVSPGNNALKDQLLALKWVVSNIESFGGDPSRVNLMGQSVGAGYVALHMINPKSSPFIHGGISHSGSSLSHWAIQNQTISTSNRIAESLGCPTSANGRSREMISCLRKQNSNLLVGRQLIFYENKVLAPTHTLLGPVIEFPHEDSFLEEPPNVVYEKNDVKSIPLLSGIVSNEGDIFAAGSYLLPGQIETINRRWLELLPFVLSYNDRTSNPDYVSSKIWEYYFHEEPFSTQNLANISQVLGDRTANQGVYYLLQHHLQIAPTYVYLFNFKGKYTFLQSFGLNPTEWGVSHVDDLIYLLNSSSLFEPISVNDRDEFAVMELMTNIWANFAATGKPLYTDANNQLVEFWEPEVNPLNVKSMELNTKTSLSPRKVSFPYTERISFWSSLNLKGDYPVY